MEQFAIDLKKLTSNFGILKIKSGIKKEPSLLTMSLSNLLVMFLSRTMNVLELNAK